ncbi:MAG: hypothetical protein M1818_005427 [Claussenomyces sp. TS43310]|nr:MAG: hypothetical protein M1818_005427 [Claussenomyces sp. TS43310]
MAATLGTPDDSDASLPVVAAKNRRFRGNNVLTKIKNAIGGRLYGSGKKQRHSAVANGHLLDDTIDGLSIHDEDDTGVSAVDMTNETKDRLFGDDPVSDVPPGPFLVRPTKFACRLKLGEKPPDPLRDHTPSKLPRNRGLNNILPQSSTHKEMDSAIDVDFDALLSSSPLGQSTPQIHLEPSFDDASKKPKNIPPGTYSVFDIGTKNERNFDSPGFHITASRQAPSVVILADNHSGRNFQIASTQRTKHPSPSKDELETPEEALRHYLPADEWDEEIAYERVANSVDDLRSSGALKRKGSFAGWEKGRDGDMKRRGFEANNSMATSASAANSGHLPKSFASKVRKVSMLAKPAGPPYILKPRSASGISAEVACKVIIGNSALDVDELQWDETAYDIGMRVA